MVSMFRDEAPWLYELGVDVYRAYTSGDPAISESIERLQTAVEMMSHGPLGEMLMRSKETHMMVRELERFMEMTFDRIVDKPMRHRRMPMREDDDSEN